MKNYLIIVLFLCCTAAFGQSINVNWEQDLSIDLEQSKKCESTKNASGNPCTDFVGKSLSTVYKVNDFYAKDKNKYMSVSEIASFLKEDGQWQLLGRGYEQQALDKAQEYANANKAAVAIYMDQEDIGHMSMILPGAVSPSGTWGFKVPNSASFFLNDPAKSYINKGLSYAFERSLIKEVLIYGRSY